MGLPEILLIAVGLAMDAFAVSLAVGTTAHVRGFRPVFRLSFHFGLFQFLMPVIGWFAGLHAESFIRKFDHWVAFGLLVWVGFRMIRAGLDPKAESFPTDPTRKWTLMMLCVATSIDALAIGLSLALLRVDIWYPSVVIGIVTAGLSLIGIQLGARVGMRFGKRMEIAGGVILCLIGVRIVLQGVLAS
jgi:putative Mn2+ efflux pump MntP